MINPSIDKKYVEREEQVMLELLGAASFGYAFDPDGDADDTGRLFAKLRQDDRE